MMTTTAAVRLTDEQSSAVDTLASLPKQVQTLGGFAGTGKTTVIRELSARLPRFAVCAYTGKATQVLRRKGIAASTIHSRIYQYVPEDEEFRLVPSLGCDGVIVDEASMVGRDVYDDLESFGVPLIFVGDHGQLDPVGSASFNLMATPDIALETIHRNAGEVAAFAAWLRRGCEAGRWEADGGEDWYGSKQVEVITGGCMDHVDMDLVDQMICAFNRTRVCFNKIVRDHTGRGEAPEVGDRVVCLQNDRDAKVFNGMQGVVTAVDRQFLTMRSSDVEFRCRYQPAAFNSEKKPEYVRGVIPFDYAYCVTAHKAQGDEWDHVLVVEQRCGAWDHRRWAYTAASRARNKLTWLT